MNYQQQIDLSYQDATVKCRDTAAQYGLESNEYHDAQHEMYVAGRRKYNSLNKTERFINFIYKIQRLLKRKKY